MLKTPLGAGGSAHGFGLLIGLEPLVHLIGQGAVGRDLDAIVIDIDVTFEGAGSFGIGDQHGGGPVVVLVGGKADDVIGIAVAEEVDLVHLQFIVFGRVERDAVVDGQGDVAVIEKADQVVDIF